MILAAKLALACAGTVVVGAGALCSEGFIRVDVAQSQGELRHINVTAPALLVPLAVEFAAHTKSRRKIAEAGEQIEPWVPAIRAALAELNEDGDMTLVDVIEPDQHVHISKSGGSIVVDVNNKDSTVHVSAPIRAISGTLQEIADSASSPDTSPHP